MKIAIVTMWFNEEILAPLFFRHYRQFADIHVLLDVATTDNTESVCNDFGANIIPHEFSDGMDDRVKIKRYNMLKDALAYDYIVGLDADEFIFEPDKLKAHIKDNRPDYQNVAFYQTYQHKDEKPINITDPVFKQRTHADPSLDGWNAFYVKPCIVRSGLKANWQPGCHSLIIKEPFNVGKLWIGAHWHMADVEIAVKRRLGVKRRQSRVNLDENLTLHNHHITEEEIRRVCKEHENDPKIF
jgi:hypothetical protein